MSTNDSSTSSAPEAKRPRQRAGRKRDGSRDGVILDATLDVLGEVGYHGMTIDAVAARAGMARATVYRRWATKVALVLAAVSRLSQADVGVDHPDTGTLRGDLIAMIMPLDDAQQRLRIRAVTGLMSLAGEETELARAATRAGIGPWIEVNRFLMQRAIDRGEFAAPKDLEIIAGLIPMMCISRAVQQLSIDPEFSTALIDGVVLPALRDGAGSPITTDTKGRFA